MNEIMEPHDKEQTVKRTFSLKKILYIATGITAIGTMVFLLLIVSLRWINPSFTAFTLQEDWEALGVERYSLSEYWVDQDAIPENLKWAVIASEDQRFWEHNGPDFTAIEQALVEKNKGERIRGASTISQQVAKNLFLWSGKSYFRKGVEAVITLSIEVLWPKERILEVYVNIAEFGPGVYGIGKGAEYFFNKEASQLSNDQAARFAAVLPNPKRMRVEPPSPYVAERKGWILRNMMQLSGIAYVPKVEEKEVTPNVKDAPIIDRVRLKDIHLKIWIPISDTSAFKASYDSLKGSF